MKIAVAGSSGRMGRALLDAVLHDDQLELGAALDVAGSPYVGRNAGELVAVASEIPITADFQSSLGGCEVLIDFTRPEGTLAHLAACRSLGVRMVIGTTGFDEIQKQAIVDAAREIAIVMAPNMSVGTNLVFKLSDIATRVLGGTYDVEIIEAHHRHKVDAPSGTALHLGRIVATALGRTLEECAVYDRKGVTGERKPGTVGFASVRGGDIVGDHTVLFAGTGERVEITVKAGSRTTYADGALRAARFVAGKKTGLFDMQDVLGLR